MADNSSSFLNAFYGGNTNPATQGIDQFQKILAANDIYKQIAAPIGAVRFNTDTWNPGTTAAVTAGQAFLAAALNTYGQESEGAQIAKVAQILPDIYKNPASAVAPEGVDAGAFGALKLSASAEQERTNQAIRQALAIKGIQSNDNGSQSAIPGAGEAEAEIAGAVAKGKAKAAAAKPLNRAQAAVADRLGGVLAGISTLDALNDRVGHLEGGSGIVGGLQRWADANTPILSSTTESGAFQRDLPLQVDQITKAVAGSSQIPTLKAALDQISLHFGQPTQSVRDSIQSAQDEVLRLGQGYVDTLAAQGVVPDAVVGANGETLADIKAKLDAATQARMAGIPASLATGGAPLAAPTTAPIPTGLPIGIDAGTLQAENEALKAQGIPAAQRAQILRAKYGVQ